MRRLLITIKGDGIHSELPIPENMPEENIAKYAEACVLGKIRWSYRIKSGDE